MRKCDDRDARSGLCGDFGSGAGGLQPGDGAMEFFLRRLPSSNVTAVEARGGVVYIGTDNGLVKLPETALVNR